MIRKLLNKNLIIITVCALSLLQFVSVYIAKADVNNVLNFQSKILFNTGTEVSNGTPPCIVSGSNNDTCDFRVSIFGGLNEVGVLEFNDYDIISDSASGDTLSVSTESSGSGRLMLATVHFRDSSANVTDITFDGGSFTKLCSDRLDTYATELWYLVDPNVSTANMVVNWDTPVPDRVIVASTFINVDTSNPINDSICNNSGSWSVTHSITVDSDPTNLVFAVGTTFTGGNLDLVPTAAGMVEVFDSGTATANVIAAGAYKAADAGSTTMSWTNTTSGPTAWPWSAAAISLNAASTSHLMYQELFNDIELGSNNGIFNLAINSICQATPNGNHSWGQTAESSDICQLLDDGDIDSITGVNFNRDDLSLQIAFDPSGTWSDLDSPPVGIEVFAPLNLTSVMSAFATQTLSGLTEDDFVQMSPGSVQNTSSSTGALRINQQGSGDILKLESDGNNVLRVDNNGQLTIGSTGGLIVLGSSGDVNLYRVNSTKNKTDDAFNLVGNSNQLTVMGLSEFKGNLTANVLTQGDGGTVISTPAYIASSMATDSSSGNTLSVSTTSTGTNRLMLATVHFRDGSANVTNITFDGNSFTKLCSNRLDTYTTELWYLINPSTATANMVVNLSASVPDRVIVASKFTGINQTTPINHSICNNSGSWTLSHSVTVDSDLGNLVFAAATTYTGDLNFNLVPTAAGMTETFDSANGTTNVIAAAAYKTAGAGSNTTMSWDNTTITPTAWPWSAAAASLNPMSAPVTTTGTGTSNKILTVTSTVNFDAGNLILVNGTTYAVIENIIGGTRMTINPAISWTNGQTVVEYIPVKIGSAIAMEYSFDRVFTNNGLRVGTSNDHTLYTDQIIQTSAGNGLNVSAKGLSLNSSGSINLNTGATGINVEKSNVPTKQSLWSTGTAGGTARYGHVSIAYNGKIYSHGGRSVSTTPFNTIDIYDIATNSWTAGTPGGTARYGHAAVEYNGKIYMWGGRNAFLSTNYNTMDIYDIATDSWTTGASGGTARYVMQGMLYNDKIYYWGGFSTGALNTMDIYNITTNSWTTGTTGGTARYLYSGILYNGKIYYWGGTPAGAGSAFNTMDIYDIAGNSWTTGATGGTARWGHSSILYNGKIYWWGGITASSLPLNTMDIYDIADNNWSSGITGGTPTLEHTAVFYNNKMYVLGGRRDSSALIVVNDMYTLDFSGIWSTLTPRRAENAMSGVEYNGKFYYLVGLVFEIYDPATDTWGINGPAPSINRYSHVASVYDNKMYVWGGIDNSTGTRTNAMGVYDFITGTWSTGPSGGTARSHMVGIVYNGKWYIWGGYNAAGTVLNTMDIYDFGSGAWSTGVSGGTARSDYGAVLYHDKIYVWAGWNGSGLINTMDIFDFKTQTWSTGAAGGTVRAAHSLAIFNGKLYGYQGLGAGSTYLDTMDVYDFATNTWNGSLPGGSKKAYSATLVSNNKMYVYGGWNGAAMKVFDVYDFGINDTVLQLNSGGQELLRLDTNNQLTITTSALGLKYITSDSAQYLNNAWITGTAGGTTRIGAKTFLYNGKIYIWGGATSTALTTYTNVLDIYDIATNSWSTGASGGTARYEYGADIVNGKIYYWGGCTNAACSTVSNVLDIYDIAGNSWSTGAAGGTARGYMEFNYYNGKLYTWGGYSGAANLNTTAIYDIAGNSWTTGTNGVAAKRDFSSVVYNGKIYYWGGFTTAVVNTMYIYDIAGNSWTSGTAGGTARRGPGAVVYKDKMYNWAGFTTVAINTMDVYDLVNDLWIPSVNTGGVTRYWHDGILYQDKIYSWGGRDGSNALNTMDIFDFNGANVWYGVSSGGIARRFLQSQVYNGKIYSWGGITGISPVTPTNNMYVYDIATDTWSTATTGGTARYGHVSALYNGKIYFLMGCTATAGVCATGGMINTMDIYDIATDTWATGTTGGIARAFPSIGLYNGKIYVWGGLNNAGTAVNTLDIYDITTKSWSTGAAGGTARYGTATGVSGDKMYIWSGGTPVTTLDIYNFVTNTWSTGTAGGTARLWPYSTFYNGLFYVWGGCSTGACTTRYSTVDVYDPQRNAWTTGYPGGTNRGAGSSVLYNNKWYLYAGYITGFNMNTMEVFNFGIAKTDDVFYIGNSLGTAENDGKLFRFDATGRAYTTDKGGWFSVGADYAEYMETDDASIESGEIVKLDLTNGHKILKAVEGDEPIGVISTSPGFVGNIRNIDDINNGNPNWKLLSMVGQVPVKVMGEINIGDYITMSQFEGVGRKAIDGEPTIGIAQEAHESQSIDKISVLITRNNQSIHNKVRILLGRDGAAGFRVSEEGKMQYKNKDDNWLNIDQAAEVDDAISWKRIGNNIFANTAGIVSIGVSEENLSDSTLQVGGNIEVKSGLSYLKISADLQSISFGNADTGLRLNNNILEFKDISMNGWNSLSGLIISRSQNSSELQNMEQVSGWGYLQGDNAASILTSQISLGMTFSSHPVVIIDLAGSATQPPTSLSQCVFDDTIESVTAGSIQNNNFNLSLKTENISDSAKYYCFNWKAIGAN